MAGPHPCWGWPSPARWRRLGKPQRTGHGRCICARLRWLPALRAWQARRLPGRPLCIRRSRYSCWCQCAGAGLWDHRRTVGLFPRRRTEVCPEGDVLAMLGGQAAIVNGHKCIGHGLCAEACPVGAISLVMASPSMGADLPYLTPDYETSVPHLFIVGELGGLALINNAVNQGRDCVDTIADRLAKKRPGASHAELYDVLIV